MDIKILFKYRSVTACMKASYDFITSNVTSLLKKTWWAVLLYAIFMATTLYFRLPNKALHDWGLQNPVSSFIIQTLVYLGLFVTNFLCGAVIWTWLNKRSLAKNLPKFVATYLVVTFFLYLFSIGGMSFIQGFYISLASKALAAKQSLTGAQVWTAALTIIDLILLLVTCLPFAHLIPSVMLKEKGEKLRFWHDYKQGLRHFGSIFSLGFLSTIIILVISMIVMLPAMIMGWAQISSQLGALDGDPLGVPGYFTPLFIVIMIATFFLFLYVCAWMGVSYAFLYGSHKTMEQSMQERKEAEKNMEKAESENGFKEINQH